MATTLSEKEITILEQEFVDIGNDLKENEGITQDIQTRTGESLSNTTCYARLER